VPSHRSCTKVSLGLVSLALFYAGPAQDIVVIVALSKGYQRPCIYEGGDAVDSGRCEQQDEEDGVTADASNKRIEMTIGTCNP
jgi:hypothetical protein